MPKFEPGNKAAVGHGRPKVPPEIRAALERLTPIAVAKLEELLGSGDERVAMQAAQEVLNRNLGKPAQPVEHSDPEGNALSLTVRFVESDGSDKPPG